MLFAKVSMPAFGIRPNALPCFGTAFFVYPRLEWGKNSENKLFRISDENFSFILLKRY